jgi:hypothetical protein
MQHSILITEELLNSKADIADSRDLIPELLLKLIAVSIKSPTELRVPFGGSAGQPGWDGIVVSPHAFDPYVPEGQSFWEFSCGNNPKAMANKNFVKRLKRTNEADRNSSTFIFVTPRSASHGWATEQQKQWIDDRRKETDWKDIRVIDGTRLVQWLYLFPGVELWLAAQFGIPTRGLSSPSLHWEDLKRYGSPPDLEPEVFLIGRQKAVEQLSRVFRGEATELLVETRYPEEGIDFVAAMLASLDPGQKEAFAGRCLIISDPETWKAMCSLQNSHVLVATPMLDLPSTGASLRIQARNKGHGVVFAGIPVAGVHGNSVPLVEAKQYELEKALISSGYPTEKARMVSNKCGGRIIVLKRLLLDISASPDWASTEIASELAIATLIGQWNGNLEGDREAVEGILGKSYGEWLGKIRPMTLRPDPPLIQRDEKWRFVSRYEGWQSLGPHLSNNDLDRFRKQAVIVLREKDPKFSLPSDERWSAPVHGKNPEYSEVIKEGFAETLALLGSHPTALTSCSVNKPESIAAIAVREIFKGADWIQWATLDDRLPLLAEASPEEFLDAVENILNNRESTVFPDLFSQESSGLMGGWNYMTGVLWALETLAWHQNYVVRVTLILGRLAEIDRGGNWANRPSNSLATIFMPWLPQTCAPLQVRKVAVEALLKECPKIAWRLLLALLPGSHQISTGSRKPSWREFIPVDRSERVSTKEYFEQVGVYSNLALKGATTDISRLSDIVGRLGDLPQPVHSEILKHLSSDAVLGLSAREKVQMWEALLDVVIKHRKFSDTQWAMPKELVDKIADVAQALKPSTPELVHRRLFRQRELELIEESGDYATQWRELGERRTKAVEEILDCSGIDGVLTFASSVTDTLQVGLALGQVARDEHDSAILPTLLLENDEQKLALASGYVWSRFNKRGWQWADKIDMTQWSNEEKAAFLVLLPFDPDTWRRVKSLLPDEGTQYWNRVDARPYQLKDQLPEATERLLQHGRPRAAIQCLDWMIYQGQKISVDQVCRALLANLVSKEPFQSLDQHACIKLIQWLQKNSGVDTGILSQIEWNYLPLLDQHIGLSPKTLERRLAEDPAFFCEVIRAVFRSDREEEPNKEPTEEQKRIATNAYGLLYNWRIPPGTKSDGSFDGSALKKWIEDVRRSSGASGHLRIALDQVGKVLAHSPPDPSGLWIHKGAAEVLNEKDSDNLRSAFTIQLFNERGMHGWTAGKEERALAADYRQKASAVEEAGYFNLAASMRNLAASYEREADHEAAEDPYDI